MGQWLLPGIVRSPTVMLAVLAAALLAAPQGPTATAPLAPPAEFGYPADPTAAFVAPFTDAAGVPQAIRARSVGLADVDGDGNRDAWFLAGAGPRDGDLEVLSAHTADLGRFVPYGSLTGGGFRAATRFRRAGVPDAIVLAEPTGAVPWIAFHQRGFPDPRTGTFIVQPTIWPIGTGAVDIDALDPDGDGHDDLVALREVRVGGTVVGCEVVRLHFGVGPGGHQLLSTATLALPVAADRVRAADLDGDGATDAVLHVPGIGVAALGIDAQGSFRLHAGLELTAGSLEDLIVGDLGGDGRDDWLVVLRDGCIVSLSNGPSASWRVLPRPTQAAPFASAALCDGNGDGHVDVVGVPRTGGVLALFPFQPLTTQFVSTELRVPPSTVPELSQGSGRAGVCAVTGDADGDGDDDLLLQLPGVDQWLTLRGNSRTLPPHVSAATVGMPSAAGFVQQRFTIDVPPGLLAAGFADLEFAVFVEDPATGESVFWDRDVVRPDPVTRRAVVTVQAMLDPLFVSWLWQGGITRHPQTGEITAFGPTVVTLHGKQGPRRAESRLVRWDGQGDPNGSAVGVRWRVVVAPPLPKTDAQLLPWD